jgi:hypothetical protein
MLVRPWAWPVLPLAAALALTALAPLAMAAGPQSPIQLNRFSSASAFASGTASAIAVEGDRLRLAPGELSGTWTSPTVSPTFSFSRLVASWNADTPADGRLHVEAQATTSGGQTSGWYVLGVWAADDTRRTSLRGQADGLGRVETDTLVATSKPAGASRASLCRRPVAERSLAGRPDLQLHVLARRDDLGALEQRTG